MADKKPAAKGGQKQVKKKAGPRISALYTISGEKITRKNRFCPKCGPGMFMAMHQDRMVCGKCKYVEYGKK